MAQVIRHVAEHPFFVHNIPFSNNRYQHREVAAKFLLLTSTGTVGDTKKAYLDEMVRSFSRSNSLDKAQLIGKQVEIVLDWANKLFVDRDNLLKTQAMTTIYFQVTKEALDGGWEDIISRQKFVRFEERRVKNRQVAEQDIAQANYDMLEFDRMQSQGSNDKTSIEFRSHTLAQFLKT